MPMSDYIRALRARIGHDVLEVPSVSIIVRDDRDRVLLVRHVEGDVWTTPGGMIEPYETPADAAVREMWEETGLYVRLTRIIGVFGGPICSGTYANGDRVAWVSTAFAATRISGALLPDGQEILEARYFTRAEIGCLQCKPHVTQVVDAALGDVPEAVFQPPTWRPEPV
jgi:ADP-ribose pyrophosphatase YjhB (NUDIX family)